MRVGRFEVVIVILSSIGANASGIELVQDAPQFVSGLAQITSIPCLSHFLCFLGPKKGGGIQAASTLYSNTLFLKSINTSPKKGGGIQAASTLYSNTLFVGVPKTVVEYKRLLPCIRQTPGCGPPHDLPEKR